MTDERKEYSNGQMAREGVDTVFDGLGEVNQMTGRQDKIV